ncbi:hypothetical protein D6T63_17595 [Arthrobacter cheniae]|uniref:Carboxymuconolactone decarboxylase-like domain-containing protein n=1 Tax=Arthrobacter cheniae TaxID=1258888 RepID=A0A3A5M6L3_9MICC|nr:hypothetical protein D6T63_17595 [Arthrobacter cheniae]
MLFRFISTVSRARFPDAARVAFYHRGFAGPELNAWTQHTMRGNSRWSVAERELMAAMVARWNACPFCVGAHSAVAVHGMEPATVRAALDDYSTAPIPDELRATMRFLEKMTREPHELDADDAGAVLAAGVTRSQLTDAVAVATVFNIITRYANALDFELPTDKEFARSSGILLKRGYA